MFKFIKDLEQRFQTGLTGPGGAEPLLLRQEIARAARNRVTAQGRGQRLFPFNLIQVEILAEGEEQAIILEESFRQGRPVAGDVLAALRQEDCRAPEDLRVEISILRVAPEDWAGHNLAIRFGRQVQANAPARLTLLSGQAGQKSYGLTTGVIYLGRSREVLDENKSLLRVNDVAFADDDSKINASVSRLHATLTYDERRRAYILRDDGSKYGTSILRGNQKLAVDTQAGRTLEDKDFIYLGRAKLLFRRA